MAGPAGPTLVPNLAPKWLKQTFDEADKNGDGSLSIGEVLQLLHKLNVNLPRQRVKQMFKVSPDPGMCREQPHPVRAAEGPGLCHQIARQQLVWTFGGRSVRYPRLLPLAVLVLCSSSRGLPWPMDWARDRCLASKGNHSQGLYPHPTPPHDYPAPMGGRSPALRAAVLVTQCLPCGLLPLLLAVMKMHPQLSGCLYCL